MTVCYSVICKDCSCGRAITERTPANMNVAPTLNMQVHRDCFDVTMVDVLAAAESVMDENFDLLEALV